MTSLVGRARQSPGGPLPGKSARRIHLQGLDERVDFDVLEGPQALRVGRDLAVGHPDGIVREFAEGIDRAEHKDTARRHRLVDRVSEPLGGRHADTESALLKQFVIVLLRHDLGVELDLALEHLRQRGQRDGLGHVDDVKLGKSAIHLRVPLSHAEIGLDDGLRIAPDVLAHGHDGLVVVLLLRLNLVNGGPADIASLDTPGLREERLSLVRLDPDLIHQLTIRLPGLVGPLGVRNPDVLGGVVDQAGVDDLDEEVQLCFRALWIVVGNVANLRLFPKYMGDQTMKNLDILGHTGPLTMVANEVHAHLFSPRRGV